MNGLTLIGTCKYMRDTKVLSKSVRVWFRIMGEEKSIESLRRLELETPINKVGAIDQPPNGINCWALTTLENSTPDYDHQTAILIVLTQGTQHYTSIRFLIPMPVKYTRASRRSPPEYMIGLCTWLYCQRQVRHI